MLLARFCGQATPTALRATRAKLSPRKKLTAHGLAMTTCTMNGTELQPSVLAADGDKYDGVIVNPTPLAALTAQQFSADLQHSLKTWAGEGKRGIWLQVPLAAVHLVEPAVRQGFVPHHAEPTHIMLVNWLPSTPNTLPPPASHQVGVGAFVVNERKEVLVVMERNGPLRGRNVWKIPTGLIHKGEDMHEGAEREVLEETGIRARFDCVLAVRQAHGFFQNNSDLFVLVGMIPEPGQDKVTPQESEIVDAKWMPLAEYESQPFMKGVELHDKLRERCAAYARGAYRGWRAAKMRAGFMAQHRHDLLLWGEHEDLLLPGDNADLSDVAVTDGNDTYTNGAVKGAQGEDGAQQVAQQAHTEPAASTARL